MLRRMVVQSEDGMDIHACTDRLTTCTCPTLATSTLTWMLLISLSGSGWGACA